MFVQNRTETSAVNTGRSKSQTTVAHQQKVKQFAQEARQKLEAVKGKTATPAQQDMALSKTRQILKEATTLAKTNPETEQSQRQESSLTVLSQETQQVKTMVDSAVVVKNQAGAAEQKEAALKNFKQELTRKMIHGLASDMPEVRANARRALSQLGVSESKLDQLRIELEKKKHLGQSGVRFGAHLPVKLHSPQGVKFAGPDIAALPVVRESSDLEQSILDDVVTNNSFDAIANQAVNYQVSNVSDQLAPVLFGSQDIQLKSGQIISIPIGANRPSDATVLATY